MGIIDKMLHDEEDENNSSKIINPTEAPVKFKFDKKDIIISILIFLIAFGIRLYFIFKVSDPQNAGDGWYGDTYHHWQIAYLTKEIGFNQSFMRLWDLKGMEFFWGPVHPLLMILAFSISGIKSIIIPRLISALFGSALISITYLLCKKYWNFWVGLSASLLAIVNPVAIFNDSSGMLEPIGFFFLVLGILILEASPLMAGLALSIALMVRAEAWFFSVLIIIFSFKFLKKHADLTKLLIGFLIPTLLYMKYLLDYTGNPIYPLWWNYLANARGAWAGTADPVFSPYQLMVRPYLIIWFVVSLLLFLLIIWKKPKGSLLLSFGFMNWAFFGGFFGLTHYLKGFEPWFWYIRFFVFPYLFLGILLSILLFYSLPKLHRYLAHGAVSAILFIPIIFFAIITQRFWDPIMSEYKKTFPTWDRTKYWGELTGKYYTDGKILISEGYPSYTYSLVNFGGIEGKNIVSQMFDPYYYGLGNKEALSWLKKENIKLMVIDGRVINVGESTVDNSRYLKLVTDEPQYFEKVGILPVKKGSEEEILGVYKVKSDMIQK